MGGRKQIPYYWRVMPRRLALFAALLLWGGSALASVTASTTGTVKDPTGAAIAGANVTVTNTATGDSF
jgi:hypothetical protein